MSELVLEIPIVGARLVAWSPVVAILAGDQTAAATNRLLYENSDGILLEDSSGDVELE